MWMTCFTLLMFVSELILFFYLFNKRKFTRTCVLFFLLICPLAKRAGGAIKIELTLSRKEYSFACFWTSLYWILLALVQGLIILFTFS